MLSSSKAILGGVRSNTGLYWPETVVVKDGILWDTKEDIVRFHIDFFLMRIAWAVPLSMVVGAMIGYVIGNGLSASASTHEQ